MIISGFKEVALFSVRTYIFPSEFWADGGYMSVSYFILFLDTCYYILSLVYIYSIYYILQKMLSILINMAG